MNQVKQNAAIAVRGTLAVVMMFCIAWQIQDRLINNVFRPGEYFAFFTIQSGMVASVTLGVGAWFAYKNRPETKLFTIVRMSVFAYEIVVGIVYNLLLRNDVVTSGPDLNYHWPVLPNEILHVWAPIIIALEWIIFASPNTLRLRANFWALLFPLAWLAFTIVRGAITGWWPYPFLNPNKPAGVPGMIEYIVVIMVAMIAFASLGLAILRLRNRSSAVTA